MTADEGPMSAPSIKIPEPDETRVSFTIVLASGLMLRDPWGLLQPMREEKDWYAAYDGAATFEDDDLGTPEIFLSGALGSGINNGEAFALFAKRSEARLCLQRLPRDLQLEDAGDENLREFASVISALRMRGVSLSKLTKILHKKRPRFIPVIDSRVETYYLEVYRTSLRRRRLPSGFTECEKYLAIIRLMRDDIRNSRGDLQCLQERMAAQEKPLTLCRLLSHLIWVEKS